ncbi:hypothetical protein L1280_000250 [Deinococcus sp. HSC-46F16]|nr:hypothetical protein [Deinococcus sp. HSC-46F16]
MLYEKFRHLLMEEMMYPVVLVVLSAVPAA